MLSSKRLILLQCCIVLWLDRALPLDTSPSTFADLTFLAEPSDVITSRDKSVAFDCSLGGGAVKKLQLEYTWFRNDLQLVLNSRRKLMQNGSLVMDGRLEEGMYHCLVTMEALGAIVSKRAELKLLSPERWSPGSARETSEVVAYAGDTVVLPCRESSGALPQYKSTVEWLKGDAELDPSNQNRVIYHTEGGMLEIRSVQFSDFGRYQCRPSRTGEWWSEVLLTQNTDPTSYQGQAPKFVARPRDMVGVEGGAVVLLCAANGRDRNGRKARVVWLKDGITLDLSTDGHFSQVGEGSLRVDGLMEEDGGQYTCRASNLEDSIDSDVTLTVQVPPKIRVRPRNVASDPDMDIQLSCDIYANPRPQVTWFKNGSPLILDDYLEMVDGHNLRMLGVEPSDSGMYQCIAQNPAGNLQAAAFLFVSRDNRTTQLNEDLPVPSALTSSIRFMRSVTISWRLPDSVANFEDVVGYLVSWEESENESDLRRRRRRTMNVTSLEANLQFLRPSTRYRVEIVSYNKEGFISRPAIDHFNTQEEAQVPEPPVSLQATVISCTSIHLSWEGSNPGLTSGFKVFYFDVSDGSTENEVTVSSTSCVLNDLRKFTTYSFRVSAFNPNGQGSSTDEITARTYSDVPSEAPQNVSLETLSSTGILVRWESPPEDSTNGIITGYRIRFKVTKDKTSPVGVVLTDGAQVFHSLTDLNKGTEYSIRVQTQTRNGTGPSSPWLQAQTLTHDLDALISPSGAFGHWIYVRESTVPGQPSSLRARPLTNSILISWTPPLNQEVMVRGYVVSYGIGAPHATRQILDAKQRYHTIKDLKPSSNYIITLMAYNAAGEGPPAYESAITREEQAYEPSVQITPPVGLEAIALSSSTILLTWTDTGLGKNQRVSDNRYYTVKYFPRSQQASTKVRPKFINSTDLNVHVKALKADTEYEFSVRIAKGRRQSVYSLSVFNRTKEASPATAPRDVTPVTVDQKPTWVSLSWQPPRQSNGQINGYLIYYTTDSSLSDTDWVVEAIMGDRLSTTVKDLSLETTYYFKVQARNNIGYGPMSPTVIFRTPRHDGAGGGAVSDEYGRGKHVSGRSRGGNAPTSPSNPTFSVPANILWIAIGCLSGIALVILMIVGVVLCRKKSLDKDDINRNGYMPANKDKSAEGSSMSGRSRELKPPDLWTHGRNLESKMTDRGSNGDPDELTEMMSRHASSIDEDGNSDTERYRCVNQRSKVVPLEGHVLREPYLISNGHLTSTMTRPNYPRTQYSAQQQQQSSTPRVNVGLASPSVVAGEHNVSLSSYEEKQDCISPASNAPGRLPSLPGKSPPPLMVPPMVPPSSTSKLIYPSTNNIHQEVTSDTKSFTTEELCAEMANLEGLMKDLSAITRQEFNC